MFNPFHLPEGATRIHPSWGPPPADPQNPANIDRFARVLRYFREGGFGGDALVGNLTLLPIPGFPAPPLYPYIRLSWPERATSVGSVEDMIVDYALCLARPEVTMTEIENHFQCGDPTVETPFEPVVPVGWKSDAPPQPDFPLGADFATGKRYVAFGDALPAGARYVVPLAQATPDVPAGSVWVKREKAQMGSAMSRWWERIG